MQHQLARLPKSEIQIFVELPFDEFEPYAKRAAVLISEQMDTEGFRRGKAPYDVIKTKVGEAAIYERAADLAVRKTYPEVLVRLGASGEISPTHPVIGRPEIIVTKLAPGNPLEYKIRVAVLPAVSLPDYKALARRARLDRKEQAASDEEINKALEWLRESRATLITVNRPAQKGDRVEIDFEIRSEGVIVAGGDSANHPFILGQGRFIPGFEEEIEGMKQNEKKTFSLAVPADWRDPAFAGKALEISAMMKLAQERALPELTEEFAKGMGDFPSLDAMKDSVRHGILTEKTEKETQRVRGAIIAAIANEAKMDVPDILIGVETEKMLAELHRGIAEMNMQWPDYLLHIKKTEDELKKEWQTEAENRVRTALVLREIGMKEQLEPAEEELAARERKILSDLRTASDAKRTIDPTELHEYAKGVLRNEKVFVFLENMA